MCENRKGWSTSPIERPDFEKANTSMYVCIQHLCGGPRRHSTLSVRVAPIKHTEVQVYENHERG